MEVGEQHLAFAQHRAFCGQRLLDLDDHLRAVEDGLRVADDLGAHRRVVCVARTDARACIVLHDHVVPVQYRLVHAVGCEADTVFVILDLLRYPDEHGGLPPWMVRYSNPCRDSRNRTGTDRRSHGRSGSAFARGSVAGRGS